MKKMISVCMTAVLAVSILAGGAVQATALSGVTVQTTAAAADENCLSGSWKRASSPELSAQVRALYEQAFEDILGAEYTPVALLSTRRTAAGTQYRALCRMALTVPDAEERYVVVTLRKNWLGQAQLLDIGQAIAPTDLAAEPLAGGWREADSPVLTEEATAAFAQAMDGLVGVDYVPVALLSTQTVAGTNYRILCEATVVYPGAEMHYAVAEIYEDPDGKASLLEVTDHYIG